MTVTMALESAIASLLNIDPESTAVSGAGIGSISSSAINKIATKVPDGSMKNSS